MDWPLRSRPAYVGEYEHAYPIPLLADGIMEGLPPKHRGSLKSQSQRFAEARDIMSHEERVAQSFGDTEGAKMAKELGDMYAKRQMEAEKKIDTVRTKGIAASGGRRKTLRAKGNGSIVTAMLGIRDQIKVYHWQTKSFARHKATDDFVTTLDGLIDSFVEVYMGKYGRPKVSGSIKLHNFSESAAKSFVSKQTAYLTKALPRKLKSTDTDLLNIRDEILALVNKTMYLFTLA